MRAVTLLDLARVEDPIVRAALDEIQKASQDNIINDVAESGAALSTIQNAAADEIAYYAGPTDVQLTAFTAFARTLVACADAAAALSALGISGSSVYLRVSQNLSDLASAATARSNLGVTATGADTTYCFRSNNLSDVTASTARSNLGVAYGKQTIWVPATAMMARTTNGPSTGTLEMSTNKNMVKTLDFDATTQEFAQFDIRMPKSWDEGTVTFIPCWSHPATATNFGVVWGLDAVAISDDDTLDVAFGTAQTSTDTGGTTNDLYQGPESSAITIAGSPTTGDYVQYRIHRDPSNGSDTLAVDARLHGIIVLYTNDTTNDS